MRRKTRVLVVNWWMLSWGTVTLENQITDTKVLLCLCTTLRLYPECMYPDDAYPDKLAFPTYTFPDPRSTRRTSVIGGRSGIHRIGGEWGDVSFPIGMMTSRENAVRETCIRDKDVEPPMRTWTHYTIIVRFFFNVYYTHILDWYICPCCLIIWWYHPPVKIYQ